ncbi:hypothetical protein [Pseudomonas chlororaphis]|uniref:hypothetical protein n=1 Tax=Pseudomonas chlororaphis TaxID=587753 RepID=UPI0021F4115D|nr:hypothetical protein [Pseudomonas chlororaphis]
MFSGVFALALQQRLVRDVVAPDVALPGAQVGVERPSNCPGPRMARSRLGTPQPTRLVGASVIEPSNWVAVVSSTSRACWLFR